MARQRSLRREGRLGRVGRGCALAPAALLLVRVLLEGTRQPIPGALVIVGLFLAIAVAITVRLRLLRFIEPHWSLWIPLAYVVWPQRDLVVAGSVAALSLLAWTLSRDVACLPSRSARAANVALFVVALAVYAATAARDVLPADAGEFQLAVARLGVAHPPGFPLYTMLGYVFIHLVPLGSPAFRLNLLSSLMAAATLVLIAAAARIWARRLGADQGRALTAGLTAAVALGTATTFWAQAGTANIRMPSTLAVAFVLYALARFASSHERKEADVVRPRALLLTGLALGLGLGHHPSLAFSAVFYVAYVFAIDPRLVIQPRRWWRLAVAVPVGVLPYVYLPIRGALDAPLAPPGLDTVQGFLNHALARGFAGDMFAYATSADLPHRVSLIPTLFRFQFNAVLVVAAMLGLALLVRQDWKLCALLAGSLAVHTFVTITYRAPQTVEYLMPAAYPVIGVAVGLCPVLFREWRRLINPEIPAQAGSLVAAGLLVAGGLNGWAHGPSYFELAGDRSTRNTAAQLLSKAPEGSLILADWHWATPLWYLQQVEGVRPDVEVRYVFNVAGEDYRQTWRQRVEQVPSDRPVLLTHYYEFDGYTTEPYESGFLIRRRPVSDVVASMTPLDVTFGQSVRVIGYSLRPDDARLGQPVEVTLAWQPVASLHEAPSLSVGLVNDAGERVALADRMASADTTSGEVRFERLTLPIYPFLAPGEYRLTLGVYLAMGSEFENLTTPDGQAAVTLRTVALAAAEGGVYADHRWSVPFEGGAELVGLDYDRSVPGTLRIYSHWRGPIGADVQALFGAPGVQPASVLLPATPARSRYTVAVDLAEPVYGPLTIWLSGRQEPLWAAGAWGWRQGSASLPRPAPDAVFIPLGADMAITGAAARPAPPGGEMIMDAQLLGLRPLTSDYAVSIRLLAEDGRWLARQDWQPALGAIPTLKWIRGSRVVDRHLLTIPADFVGVKTHAELVAYERFREAPLPPMDGRFSQAPLGSWAQPDAAELQ